MRKTLKSIVLSVMAAAMVITGIPFSASAAASENVMTVPTMYYGNEAPANYTYGYDQSTVLFEDKYERVIVVPMKLSQPGTVRFNFSFPKLEKDMTFGVYTDAGCTNSMSANAYFYLGDIAKEKFVSFSSAGTYYIKLYSSVYNNAVFANTITMSVRQYTMSDKTIKSRQTISYYRTSGNDRYYFKYVPAKTGKVSVFLPYEYGSYVTLLNGSKKALSEREWVSKLTNSSKFTFAVKKGQKYYFLVTSNGVSGGQLQTISIKETAIKEKSGAKKKKAVTIKSGKNINGLVAAGESRADWYKFKVKKDKKLKINVSGNVSGKLNILVYRNSQKVHTYSFYGGSAEIKTLFGKSKRGTYYIKIARSNPTSSGSYTLRWK